MKNDLRKAMSSGGDRRRVISILDGLSTTLNDVEDLMSQYFDRPDKNSPDFVKRTWEYCKNPGAILEMFCYAN